MRHQFHILDFLLFTTAVAAVFGISRYTPCAALVCCPAMVGATVGYWQSRSQGGAVSGALSAYFWSIPMGGGFLAGFGMSGFLMQEVAIVVILVASVLGGYVGGVAQAGSTPADRSRPLAAIAPECEAQIGEKVKDDV